MSAALNPEKDESKLAFFIGLACSFCLELEKRIDKITEKKLKLFRIGERFNLFPHDCDTILTIYTERRLADKLLVVICKVSSSL